MSGIVCVLADDGCDRQRTTAVSLFTRRTLHCWLRLNWQEWRAEGFEPFSPASGHSHANAARLAWNIHISTHIIFRQSFSRQRLHVKSAMLAGSSMCTNPDVIAAFQECDVLLWHCFVLYLL